MERESFVAALSTALANALDARDSETGGHGQRPTELSIALGREALDHLRFGALLHDIGKIGVPDEILRKPGRLSDSEWEIMRRHPGIGERIIAPVPALEPVAMIVRHHHEWFDGSGYPDGLSAGDAPVLARAISVADSYCTRTDPIGPPERISMRSKS